jgi:hypothetical protein
LMSRMLTMFEPSVIKIFPLEYAAARWRLVSRAAFDYRLGMRRVTRLEPLIWGGPG